MPATITVLDETVGGDAVGEPLSLDVLDETITVRELIRSRVYQEVDDHNRRVRAAQAAPGDGSAAVPFRGLVTPTAAERSLNGPSVGRGPAAREVDWRGQFDAALAAFDRNGFFVLVGDRQAESLDDEITVGPGTTVSFVKLTPLVGG